MGRSFQLWKLTLVVAILSTATMAGELKIVQGEKRASIAEGERSLVDYRFGDVKYKPYIERLYSPHGTNILRDAPHDHLHHHGLMLGLVVDGVDFWGEFPKRKPGIQVGGQLKSARDASSAAITQRLDWLTADKQALLGEERTIEAYTGNDLKATLVTWQSRLRPAEGKQSVSITGTHYDGLGMRLVESMDGVGEFQYARDEPGPVVRGTERVTKTKWCSYTAPAGGKPVTVAVFDHPRNPRGPAGMFTMLKPFAYISATPNVWKDPLVLKAGETITFRYGIALWDGRIDKPTIERMYQQWLKLPVE